MTGDPANPRAGGAINVRPALFSDIPAIRKIEQQAPAASHWSAKEYERILGSEVLLAAEIEGQVAGFVCAKSAAGEWELENIAVAATVRRRGVAGELLRGLIDRVGKNSNSMLFLEVRESNLPARKFYEKHGFGEVGRRRNYYRQPDEDAVLYTLRITGAGA